MARQQKIAKRPNPKAVLRLPDLEQSKNAVLNSLAVGHIGGTREATAERADMAHMT